MKEGMPNSILVRGLDAIFGDLDHQWLGKNLCIHIRNGLIESVGENLEVPEADIIDASGCVAIPGLVNCHHHFYQILTRAIPRMQNAELFPWLIDHYRVWEGIDEESVFYSSLAAMSELALTGCTLTSDHHYLFPSSASRRLIDAQFKAASEIGIRFLATRGSMSLSKSMGGLPPDSVVQSEDEILKDSQRLIEDYHDASPGAARRIALAPCSPFSVTPELMIQTARLARAYGVRLHTHLAETRDEENYCIKKFGCRPVELMEKLEWIGNDVWFAHCVCLNQSEIELFARTGAGVAHCPSSNMRLASGVAPIKELLAKQSPVGLAVDGSASNDSSDMLGEVRQALLLQRVAKGAGALTPFEALSIATAGGAKILGFEQTGSIRPGYFADIAIFRTDGLAYAGVHDPIAGLVMAGFDHRAFCVMARGNIIVRNGRLQNLDEAVVAANARVHAARLLKSACERTGIDFFQKEIA
jgi:8-oxoguanine deaminase